MDREVYWSRIHNREDTPNLADYLLPPNDTNMTYANLPTEDNPSLNIWNSTEPNLLDQENNDDEVNMELENILSLNDVDINLNNQIGNDQPIHFSFNSNLNDLPQDLEQNSDVSEPTLFSNPYVPSTLQQGQGSSSSSYHAYDDRLGSSIEGRRLACKRKHIEGQGRSSSTTAGSLAVNNTESSDANAALDISGPSRTVIRRVNPTVGASSESSLRNFRLRINHARHHSRVPPNLLSSRDSIENLSSLLAEEHSSSLIAFNQRLESRATQSPTPNPSSRSGSPSDSTDSIDLITTIREENLVRIARNSRGDISTQSSIASENAANIRQVSRERERQAISRGDGVQSHSRLHASLDSESREQLRNFLMQHSPSSILQEGDSGSQQGDGPMPTRQAREGRRSFSEIRNVLDRLRRGERLRIEDIVTLDHPLFHGMADMHDRHRDMRLDVDNMSYEELLALEERIGNVSTGLSEDKIMKLLKQQKYVHTEKEVAVETEPCCICQEEYVEGEDVGTLDCTHDFHVVCIKQWLTQKNICPVCKTTALIT